MDITLVRTHPITQLDPNITGKKPICCASKQPNSLCPAPWIIPRQIPVDTDRAPVSEGRRGCQAEQPVLPQSLPLLPWSLANQKLPLAAERMMYGRFMTSHYFWDKEKKMDTRKERIISRFRLGEGRVRLSRRQKTVELTTPATAQGAEK